MGAFELVTPHLSLVEWRSEHCEAFAALNADPEVMEFLGPLLSRAKSDETIARFQDEFGRRGFCPWAAVERSSNRLVGFVGLHEVPEAVAFAPAVEVGWRLARPFWGLGYATEGATASLDYAFETLGIDDVVSMTTRANERSRRVMERIGMTRDPREDFEHPGVSLGDDLRPHILYRITSAQWAARRAPAR
jgi:RimJ/RimL family protein N-acetyltransferase